MNAGVSRPFSFLRGIFIPLLLCLVITPWSGWLDLEISNYFYQEKEGGFIPHAFWNWIYLYGTWPAWLMAGAALAGLFLSIFKPYRSWCKPCLYLVLTLAIGSGLIIHAVLKDHWGRPRPRQVTEFGGQQPFQPYYQPNFGRRSVTSKSFACGHCSMGFYFFALALIGRFYQSSVLYWLGMALAWGLGGLLSLARIAQGGHFFSDTLASALIMWLTAWILAYLLLRNCTLDPINLIDY